MKRVAKVPVLRDFIYTIVYDSIRSEFELIKVYEAGGCVRLGRFPDRRAAELFLLGLPAAPVWPNDTLRRMLQRFKEGKETSHDTSRI